MSDLALPSIRGRVAFVFEEVDFDVDQIIGVKNIKLRDPAELASVAMQSHDPSFAQQVKQGDVLVGAANFGYGHPHYPPMIAMRHLGIAAVIAESFSPGYWRGEIAMGFPQIACPGVLQAVCRWDELEVDWMRHRLINHTQHTELPFEVYADADREMLAAGGIMGYLKHLRAKDSA
jgi:3-isopropylmalate/(R)-2-methylmalate dehydratase small subunit